MDVVNFFQDDFFDKIDFLLENALNSTKFFIESNFVNYKSRILILKNAINISMLTILLIRIVYSKVILNERRYTIDININLKMFFTIMNIVLVSSIIKKSRQGIQYSD
jgi:hypothetical protein